MAAASSFTGAATGQASPAFLAAKAAEYRQFRDNVLARDMARLLKQCEELQCELEEYKQLEAEVAGIAQAARTELHRDVDLGCGVYCAACVPDPSRIYVAVGLGFHVECLLGEVPAVTAHRRTALQEKLQHAENERGQLQQQIDFVDASVRQLDELAAGQGQP